MGGCCRARVQFCLEGSPGTGSLFFQMASGRAESQHFLLVLQVIVDLQRWHSMSICVLILPIRLTRRYGNSNGLD
jgi:hypothetical protein